ncbi:MAG: phosphatase PAP2 family protein [Acidimicrobiales bacterium]
MSSTGSRRGQTALAVAALFSSAAAARTHRVSPSEAALFRRFNQGPDAAHVPIWAVMQSGSLGAVLVLSLGLHRRHRPIAATTTLITGVGVWGGVKLVKPLVGRGRPQRHLDAVTVRGPAQTGLGYPSGHAAVSLVLALTATRDSLGPIRAAALAAAAATGGARMYVGAHLPLDVVGGFAVGVLCGQAADTIEAALVAR